MIDRFYRWLATIKDSPRVWELSLPLLVVLAVHFGPLWWPPLLALVAAAFVPAEQSPEAQRIHFSVSYIAIGIAHWWGLLWLPVAFLIEYVWDPRYEGDPWRWGGAVDFGSYAAGALAGVIGMVLR